MTTKIVDAYGAEHYLFGPFDNLAQVEGMNRRLGHHWFDVDSKRFFGSRTVSALFYGRLFVSSEQQPTTTPDDPVHPRLFTIRLARDDGAVVTVGEFQQYETRDDALDALHQLARLVGA